MYVCVHVAFKSRVYATIGMCVCTGLRKHMHARLFEETRTHTQMITNAYTERVI